MIVQTFKPSVNSSKDGVEGKTYDCKKCGRTWTCSPKDCWCEKLDIRLPLPKSPNATCLCPCELEALSNHATNINSKNIST